ncbi:MAG: S8 family serine peptidase [Candidatus Saccharibacteria bacterium]
MKTKLLLLLVIVMSSYLLSAQVAVKDTYWVKLKDKKGTPYAINHPEAFLSQRSIDRRHRQQIAVNETDLPVSPVYLDSLKKLGLEIVHSSKWLNGTTVRTDDPDLMRKVSALSFVSEVQLTKPGKALKSARNKFNEPEMQAGYAPAHYGKAYKQLSQLNGQYLHNKGFRGKGIQVAVLDAGFWHVNQIAAFDSLRSSHRILGTHDFVDPHSDIYQQHTHGMSVLSTMGGNIPGTLVGTAPDASFYLFRSEDDASENLIEEDNWVAAAELADSVGADVINSSLGYNLFDDSTKNHTYADMNGVKTRVTQGANMAFSKGILVFTSAGNEGRNAWRHIIAPTDGVNVISVAAVDSLGNRAPFSSIGPAYGGAVKPNLAARGRLTYLVASNGELGYSNGTSFSSPVLAGMGACLIQANPQATVKQIKLALEQSGSRYLSPDSLTGYGIPDFEKADSLLKLMVASHHDPKASWQIWPNPFTDYLVAHNLKAVQGNKWLVKIYNLQGVCLWQKEFSNSEPLLLNNLGNLPNGLLILSIRSGDKEEQIKLIKAFR